MTRRPLLAAWLPRLSAGIALGVSLLAGAPVAARQPRGPCRPEVAVLNYGAGVLPSGAGPADFGMVPEACPAFDLLARLRGSLLVASEMPDYYGNIAGGLFVRVRHTLDPQTWLSLAFDAATYRYVANAVVRSSGWAVGPPTLGLYHRLALTPRAATTVYGRLLLPFDTARDNGLETGGELGAAAWVPLGARHGVQGGVAIPALVTALAGQTHTALRPAAVAEGYWAPWDRILLVAGAGARTAVSPDVSWRSLAGRAAVRVALPRGWSVAAAGELPLWGSDRTDLLASLFLGWTAPRL